MGECNSNTEPTDSEAISHLRTKLEQGASWPTALLEAMALWTAPEETFLDTRLVYLIGSEAFDWLALANRLCFEVRDLIPKEELESLLFMGRFPDLLRRSGVQGDSRLRQVQRVPELLLRRRGRARAPERGRRRGWQALLRQWASVRRRPRRRDLPENLPLLLRQPAGVIPRR